MRMRSCLALLLGLGTLYAGSALPPEALAKGAQGPITVQGAQFYSGRNFHFNPCNPSGPASTSFLNSTRRIFANVSFSNWQGKHRVRFKWYSPNGKLYDSSPASSFTDNGPTTICNYLSIAGYKAEDLVGRWTFRLFADRHPVIVASFTLLGTSGPVGVRTIRFYSGRHIRCPKGDCRPTGAPATVFRNTVARIFAFVRYRTWQGTHRDRYQFFAPNGRRVFDDLTSPYTSHGPTTGWDYISIARTRNATYLGRWTFRLLVDGRVYRAKTFSLVR
jgi:hypothetical protein